MTTRQKNKIIYYRKLGLSVREIAKLIETSSANVHRFIKNYL